MTQEELTTKDKIIEVAHKLFADKGFNGASIREIAKEASVNIAAINYHFGNKESLYSATISNCMFKMRSDLENIYHPGLTTAELSILYYEHLISNKNDLVTSFKLFLDIDNESLSIGEEDKTIGPPGGAILFKCIQAEVPEATIENIHWAVRVIFIQIIHTALLMCNHSDEVCKNTGMTTEDMKNQIRKTVNLFIKEIHCE